MPLPTRPDVLEFFDRYQRGADESDPEVVRDCFAETFLNPDPRTWTHAAPDRFPARR